MMSLLVVTASSLNCMQLPLHSEAETVYQAAAKEAVQDFVADAASVNGACSEHD